jgi:hypothetical protein
VNDNGAYWGEMSEIVTFEKALRAAVPSRPDPSLGSDLVPRLAQAARTSTLEMEDRAAARGAQRSQGRRARPRRAWMARVGVVVAALPLLLAGLAFAGVTMPSPVRSAFDSAGVHLPNQPSPRHAAKTTPASILSPSQSESAASPDQSRGFQGKAKRAQNGKAKRAQNQTKAGKPGRRVRRHGKGPVPGPASPPPGNALGHVKPHGNSQNTSGGSGSTGSPGNSGNAPGQTGVQGGGASNGHGKPG